MAAHVDKVGRQEPNTVLDWWRSIENSSIVCLRKRKLYLALLLLDPVRAYLSVQSSSASAERLFRDSGYHEGIRWQHAELSVTEMLLMIRSFVHSRINDAPKQQEFLSSRAQAVKDLAEVIAEN